LEFIAKNKPVPPVPHYQASNGFPMGAPGVSSVRPVEMDNMKVLCLVPALWEWACM